jgi:acetyl esterase/lipase
VTYVHPGAPPFLIIRGTEDLLVKVAHARTLSDRLTAASVPVTLLLVEHARHGLRSVGGEPDPSRVEVIQRIAEVFDRD